MGDGVSLKPIRTVSWCIRDQERVNVEPGDDPERWEVEVEGEIEASGLILAK